MPGAAVLLSPWVDLTCSGGRAELQRNAGLFHVWPITVPYVREARRTAADVVRFLDHELA